MIADRYEPVEQIGTGGMATVWRARDTLLGRSVAIKRLLPHLASDPVAAERFKREAQSAAGLSHPGIVIVFDSGEDEDGPYIVLELIEGITLADHLAGTGALDPATVADIVSQVASALDHAHAQGLIHRDIKPANVILDAGGRARLADFGIARTVEDPATITASGELVGTISYLAPEILAGEPASPASDVYSLGAVAYELLTGAPPYQAETPAALLEAVRSGSPPSLEGRVPAQMASAVSAAMAKDPASRPASAGDLASAMIGSVTLVLGPDLLSRRSELGTASEEPTMETAAPSGVPPPEPAPSGGARWSLAAAVLAILAIAAAAMTTNRDPAGTDDPGRPLAAATTTSPTTTVATTSTTVTTSTTTTRPTTSTTPVRTPETVAGEINALLATIGPPQFHPRELSQVEDRLKAVMEEWENNDREDLTRELERAFDEVADLEESEEQAKLRELFIELAELMGFAVDEGGRGAGDGGDD